MKNLFIFCTLITFLGSCNHAPKQTNAHVVNVSIAPQKYLVDKLSGGKYTVNVVVKNGQNHETYEPTPQQMMQLEQAGLYLMLCKDGFDQVWANHIHQRNPGMAVVDLSQGIDLLDSEHDCAANGHNHRHAVDPHLWISPSTMARLAENSYHALLTKFPADSVLLKQGFTSLKNEIDSLDNLYKSELHHLAHRTFMIYHPVMGYVARDYALEQLPIETEGKEPSVEDIKQLIDKAREKQVKAIFVQQEYDTRNAQLIADETGLAIQTFNPMNEDWPAETLQTLHKLTAALK